MILTEIFGNTKRIQVLESFLENKDEELSAPEIQKMVDIPKATAYRTIKALLSKRIIKKSSRTGKTQFYKLNFNNPITKPLILFEKLVIFAKLDHTIGRCENEEYERRKHELVARMLAIREELGWVPDLSTEIKS